MKKLILAALAMGLGGSLHAQGTVTFANTSSTRVTTNLQGAPAATTASGGTVRVALYWGVLGSAEAQLVQIGPSAGISPLAGRINAGNYTTGAATAPGTVAVFQVRGWTGNFATYEAAYSDYVTGGQGTVVGSSTLFTSITGGIGTPPTVPVSLAGILPSFMVGVPEPSTYAILGVGLLGLLWKSVWRRR